MAEEPENLVLEILRRMQGDMASMKSDISGIKRVQDNHTLKLDFLAERVEMLHEGTMALDRPARRKRRIAGSSSTTNAGIGRQPLGHGGEARLVGRVGLDPRGRSIEQGSRRL